MAEKKPKAAGGSGWQQLVSTRQFSGQDVLQQCQPCENNHELPLGQREVVTAEPWQASQPSHCPALPCPELALTYATVLCCLCYPSIRTMAMKENKPQLCPALQVPSKKTTATPCTPLLHKASTNHCHTKHTKRCTAPPCSLPHLFSLNSRAASELAGELGLGSLSSDCNAEQSAL